MQTLELNAKLIEALRWELFFAEGRAAALQLAANPSGDIAMLQARSQEVTALLTNPPVDWQAALSPGRSPRVYQEGYLAGLQEGIDLVTKNPISPERTYNYFRPGLFRPTLLAEGRQTAFRFVWDNACDAPRILAEISDSEDMIANPDMAGPMAPGASPRVFKDGYLAGLKDAVSLITGANTRPILPSALPPPWFSSDVQSALQQQVERLTLQSRSDVDDERHVANGQMEAGRFAQRCEADLIRLQAEVKAAKSKLFNPSERTQSGWEQYPQLRLYTQGYLIGLDEIIKLIDLKSFSGNGH